MFETNELLQEFYKLFFYDSLLIFVSRRDLEISNSI